MINENFDIYENFFASHYHIKDPRCILRSFNPDTEQWIFQAILALFNEYSTTWN